MIASRLEDSHKYQEYAARFEQALAWLRSADLAHLELGVHTIDGNRITANVQEFTTALSSEKAYEAHRRYADIHYVVSGEELVGVAHISEVKPLQEFDDQADFCLYGEPKSRIWVPLHAGEYVITMPEDAHKPGCALESPKPLRKVCVKVLVSE
ncbi:YhcH/YjgK/YiaL family protein [Atopobium fossor]|uniref:YhcH/YjgK/YiaL family protein n=1 Tax=Atopobium fossor TaxID=39487 RepID=UPI0004080B7B|nr:YhcH/YjgK/YiaL family protein [Atopobium fossor]